MSKLFLLTIVLISAVSIGAQTNKNSGGNPKKPNVIFSGKVTGIESKVEYWREIPQADRIWIKLDISLKNNGSVPVMFLEVESGSAASIWEMADEGETHGLVYTPSLAGSSYAMKKSEWEKFKSQLDKSSPPENTLHILKPGETYNFKEEVYLRLIRQPEQLPVFTGESPALERLQKLSPLWLKLRKETWDTQPVLTNKHKFDSNKKRDFLAKLQKRWSSYGYLWLDDITSEPIPFDLNSLTVKTESQR